MKAYILISIETGELKKVLGHLKRIAGVVEANMTFGPYDAVAVVESESVSNIGQIMADEIQPIPGVRNTLTCLAIDY
ncbi:MAG: Lrp/AsnC ligand binding domain-containing protein [Anaerolineales bacterium]|nr:Lrp/AsnC ligand binding domain-containing protein [Anaerolineales bacterium]